MDDLDLSPQERAAWIGFIRDQQNEADGTYRHITGHCRAHAFCHATGALNMLGGTQRHAPVFLDAYRDPEKVAAWLDGIDWVRQWGGSHDIWGAGLPLVCTTATDPAFREAIFAWLDGAVDPATGFWKRGVKAKSRLEYLGGAFHIWPLYAAMNRKLPHGERVIDSVLTLQRADGSFDGGFGYGNMDGVWVLAYLKDRTPYRRNEVLQALERSLEGLMARFNRGPGAFFGNAHGTLSRIATLAILEEALPEKFTGSKRWRNPWYRRELFVVKIVTDTLFREAKKGV